MEPPGGSAAWALDMVFPGGLPYGFPVFGCMPGRAFNAASGCVAAATFINLTPPSPILVRGSSNGLVFIRANLPAAQPRTNALCERTSRLQGGWKMVE